MRLSLRSKILLFILLVTVGCTGTINYAVIDEIDKIQERTEREQEKKNE